MRTATVLTLLVLFLFSCFETTKGSSILSNKLGEGWETITWTKFTDAKIEFVCLNEAKICKSKIRWKNLAQELENSTELWMIDYENGFQKQIRNQSMSTGEDLERMKDNVCDLVIVKQKEDESFVKYYTPNRCKWTEVRTKTTDYSEENEESEENQ